MPFVRRQGKKALCRLGFGTKPERPAVDDKAARDLISSLEASERFRRDGPISGIFHPGRISFRELSPRDSLHISIDGNHVSAHVDDVCPLRCIPGGTVGFSWVLVLAHNLSMMAADLGRRLRGLHGQQRCRLGCEMVWVEDDEIAELAAEVQDGTSSATRSRFEDEA